MIVNTGNPLTKAVVDAKKKVDPSYNSFTSLPMLSTSPVTSTPPPTSPVPRANIRRGGGSRSTPPSPVSPSSVVEQPRPVVIEQTLTPTKIKDKQETQRVTRVTTKDLLMPTPYDSTIEGKREARRERFEDMYGGRSSGEILGSVRLEGYGEGTTAYLSPLKVEAEVKPYTISFREKAVYKVSQLPLVSPEYKGMSEYEFKTTVLDNPNILRAKIVRGGENISSFFQGMPSRFEEVTKSKRVGVDEYGALVEVRPRLSQRVTSAGVRGVSVIGDVVIGESLQKPEVTALTYIVGNVVGVGAKALKIGTEPLLGRIAIIAKDVPSVGRAVKGVGIGFRTGAVIGVGGLVAQDIVLSEDRGKQVVRIAKDFALFGSGYRRGFSTSIRDLNVPVTGERFSISTSPSFDYVKGGVGKQSTVQAYFSRSGGFGGYISDKEIIRKTGTDVLLGKGSPLGLPRDYYQSLQTGLQTSNKLNINLVRTDKSSTYIKTTFKQSLPTTRGFDEPYNYFEPRVSARTGEAFGADLVRVGEVQKRLADPVVRVVNIRTGKERDVASRVLDKTLADDSALKVVGVTKQKDLLYAGDPFGAIVVGVQERGFVNYKPSFSTRSPSSVVFNEPVFSRSSFDVPVVFSSTLLKDRSLLETEQSVESRRDVRLKPLLSGVGVQSATLDFSKTSVVSEVTPVTTTVTRLRSLTGTRTVTTPITSTITTPITTPIITPITPITAVPRRPTPRTPVPVVPPFVFPVLKREQGFSRKAFVPRSFTKLKGSLATSLAGSSYIFAPNRKEAGEVFALGDKDTLSVKGKKRLKLLFGGFFADV